MKALNLIILFFIHVVVADDDLPTNYEYYTSHGLTSGLSVEKPYFALNGINFTVLSGGMHYFRIHPDYWQDRLKKVRAAGLNTVETYIPWNLHEPKNGVFEFGDGSSGSDYAYLTNLDQFLTLAQQEDLFVIVRPGPYICAEWEWGGYPSWLIREPNITLRSLESTHMSYVTRYFNQLMPILAKHQFTKGGSIIGVQVENEYGYVSKPDQNYLQALVDLMKDNEIQELLMTSDGAKKGTAGSIPGVLFQTVNFKTDPDGNFKQLKKFQPNKPLMAMELYPGWYDQWAADHHTVTPDSFKEVYEAILKYPASANFYMFHGGTNFGFLNGANNGGGDNSAFKPVTTSYDYDAILSENGDYTEKYTMLQELIEKYRTVKTLTPDPPELIERIAYDSATITEQISYSDLISSVEDLALKDSEVLPMEQLSINDGNGQSYGYIVYRQEKINISANAVLTIKAHVRDSVTVLINGERVSPAISSVDDLEKFGFWRLENSNLTLTDTDLTDVTLDLLIENWGRVNFGAFFEQYKGLIPGVNNVYIDKEELTTWDIYPLEFSKSWISNLSWSPVENNELFSGPALYRTVLTLDTVTDTYIDSRPWNHGVVIVNGFVLGRYAPLVGPQNTLYLPAPFLKAGDNEIIFFEHFTPANEVTFTKDPIF